MAAEVGHEDFQSLIFMAQSLRMLGRNDEAPALPGAPFEAEMKPGAPASGRTSGSLQHVDGQWRLTVCSRASALADLEDLDGVRQSLALESQLIRCA